MGDKTRDHFQMDIEAMAAALLRMQITLDRECLLDDLADLPRPATTACDDAPVSVTMDRGV